MTSNKKTARLAGFFYFIVVLSGIFSLMYVPSTLFVRGDVSATIQNIKASEFLYRSGMVSAMICYVFFLLLPLVLYKLLQPVNDTYAKLMVALAVVSVPISLLNIQNRFAILTLINDANYLTVFGAEQLQAQVLFYLRLFNDGNLIAQIFWALWLFPLGFLIFKSGFLPKFLGIILMVGSAGYVLDFFGWTLLPNYQELPIADFATLPASIGEIGTCLWLLIAGAKEKEKSDVQPQSTVEVA
ncbi:MAG: DUF4386 domain-containing protein [Bacteroidota bacterium]